MPPSDGIGRAAEDITSDRRGHVGDQEPTRNDANSDRPWPALAAGSNGRRADGAATARGRMGSPIGWHTLLVKTGAAVQESAASDDCANPSKHRILSVFRSSCLHKAVVFFLGVF